MDIVVRCLFTALRLMVIVGIPLLLCTYMLFIHNTTKRVNMVCRHSSRYGPVAQMLLCCLVPFYFIYWGWRQGDRLDTETAKHGLNYASIGPSCMWMGLVMPLIAVAIVRNRAQSLVKEVAA